MHVNRIESLMINLIIIFIVQYIYIDIVMSLTLRNAFTFYNVKMLMKMC